ncbi:MAG: DegT/DnrJ/EryC1/StrS family aminotransferase [Candidatus Amulumruptor caecigallinarius]|nr:DegT/DnrJ/EryC1/StrS family aminotransferase [Candidatus Amulumruptor caecigallinarius]MCM1395889.1 DegT/DnrJ/EryC1/StrS family aminotransferase [Candidatus Amulumruptor caecigallinarius]MCM1452924.1 DegT/DnrJ/EryC1/StrS family aminotransferase [bacterium]
MVRSGRYIGGEECEALENDLRSLTGAGYAIGTGNGLDALTLILRGYVQLGKLRKGDGVIVPANTFIATILAVTAAGLRPIPVDADPLTYNIDAAAITESDLAQAKAIMVTHLYGRNAWTPELRDLAMRRGLITIEDAAQSIGATSATPGIAGGLMTGHLGHAAAFSFYPTKNVGALGDAGIVTTDDQALASAVHALANYGSDRRYHNIYAGVNSRLDPIQAAMIRVKLRHIEHVNSRRRENAALYTELINSTYIVPPQAPVQASDHVWHQYVIDAGAHREEFRSYLTDRGVGTDIHYPTPPMHQPCYQALDCRNNFAITDRLASSILSLPISEATSTADVREISNIINEFKRSAY